MADIKGLELLYLLVRDQLTCKEDCLIAALHCLMINGGMKCVGIGDECSQTSSETGSEALPQGWNTNNEVYSLRYISNSAPHKYLLKVVKAGHSLLINMLNVSEERSAGMSVNINNHVSDNFYEFSSTYINMNDISESFNKEVLGQVTQMQKSKTESSPGVSGKERSHKHQRDSDDTPLQSGFEYQPQIAQRRRTEGNIMPSIGRGDLDPFSGGHGGGMLADPRSFGFPSRPGLPNFGIGPHGIPRGAVPPGARFDPLGPPVPGGGRGFSQPDPDHLPPPGYDDMFM